MSKLIKDLFLDNQFDKVIQTVQLSNDPEDVYFKIDSLIELNKLNEAYELFLNNRELVEKWDIKSTSYIMFVLLIKLKASDATIEKEINYYLDYPYISQEVEEYMHNLREIVIGLKKAEDTRKENIYLDDIYSIPNDLKSDDSLKVSIAIAKMISFYKKGIEFEKVALQYTNTHNQFDCNYAYLFYYLVIIESKTNICFKKDDKYFTINPSEFSDYIRQANKIINNKFADFARSEKNINIISYVKSFYLLFFLYLLPYKIAENEIDTFFEVLIRSGYKAYLLDEQEDEYLKSLRHNNKIYDYFLSVVTQLFKEISAF